jgi:hypothetical protein
MIYDNNIKKGIENIEQNCLACGQHCTNRRSLGNHVNRSHKELEGLRGYVLKHMLNNIIPKCKCGCETDVLWHNTHYSFNNYVNGHNETGFEINQYVHTQEQIDKRNNSIRKTYSERGDEIKNKISKSVSIGLKESEFDFTKHWNNLWQDEEFKNQQHESRIKSWEGEAGDERRIKVFTPEFGRKISEANMKRDAKRTSQVEILFATTLKQIFPDLETSKWFNFSERTWCADIWIPQYEAIVEIDGVYWHGLDRTEDFTYDQIVNITNDIKKNELAKSKCLTLLRLSEDIDISTISSFEDLTSLAYHVVIKGSVIKEGTFKLSEKQVLFSRDELIKSDEEWRENKLLPVLIDLFRAQVSYYGWFYPETEYTVDDAIIDLQKGNDAISSTWLKSTVKSFWDVDRGPRKSFDDDLVLTRVLKYRLGLNNSKPYTYTLKDGTTWTGRETFDINITNVRRGFVVQRNTVSWFKPSFAAYIYKKLLGDIESPKVWDPSIGFSARLFGFASVYTTGTYIGTDPSSYAINDAEIVKNQLITKLSKININLNCIGSEKFIPEKNEYDLVFTSPPYFNTEKYIDEPGQCWRDFPSINEWIDGYLIPTFTNIYTGLKNGGLCAINIHSNLANIIEQAAEKVGLIRRSDLDLKLILHQDHFAKKRDSNNVGQKSEPVLVFQKI